MHRGAQLWGGCCEARASLAEDTAGCAAGIRHLCMGLISIFWWSGPEDSERVIIIRRYVPCARRGRSGDVAFTPWYSRKLYLILKGL